MMLRTTALIVMLATANIAMAEPSCSPSAQAKDYDYPGVKHFPTTNNLMLPTGKAVPIDGQMVIITGRVLDSQCKPVPEATVELWQASPLGRWQIPGAADFASVRPQFAGAGRTYTNSDGTYSFITAFPAPSRYATPNVNIRVKLRGLPTYSSALFFAGDVRNDKDKAYQTFGSGTRDDVSIVMREGEDGALIGALDIVLAGKAPYRTY